MRVEKDIEELAIERLRSKFPGKSSSWVKHALKRFESGSVRQINENAWVVSGDPRLVMSTQATLFASGMGSIIAHASRPTGGG